MAPLVPSPAIDPVGPPAPRPSSKSGPESIGATLGRQTAPFQIDVERIITGSSRRPVGIAIFIIAAVGLVAAVWSRFNGVLPGTQDAGSAPTSVSVQTLTSQERSRRVSGELAASIRAVDFRNFTYTATAPPAEASSDDTVILHEGKAMSGEGRPIELQAIAYADFDGDGREDATIEILTESAGSMGYSTDYYVYSYQEERLVQVFHHYCERCRGMSVAGNALQLTEPSWSEGEPNCCPGLAKTTTYKWSNHKFAVGSVRVDPVASPGN